MAYQRPAQITIPLEVKERIERLKKQSKLTWKDFFTEVAEMLETDYILG